MPPVSSLPVVVSTDIVGAGPSRGVVEGRLNNSEVLANLGQHASHMCESKKSDIIKLITSYPSLFSDIPTRTHIIEHDIDVVLPNL